eukprot:23996-Eustigmatos_ZCMA.PRE.1
MHHASGCIGPRRSAHSCASYLCNLTGCDGVGVERLHAVPEGRRDCGSVDRLLAQDHWRPGPIDGRQ